MTPTKVQVDRADMSLDQADRYLAGQTLSGTAKITSQAGQKTLVDDLHPAIKSTFASKGFRVTPTKITGTLSFIATPDESAQLTHFPKRSGRLLVDAVTALDDDEERDEENFSK